MKTKYSSNKMLPPVRNQLETSVTAVKLSQVYANLAFGYKSNTLNSYFLLIQTEISSLAHIKLVQKREHQIRMGEVPSYRSDSIRGTDYIATQV